MYKFSRDLNRLRISYIYDNLNTLPHKLKHSRNTEVLVEDANFGEYTNSQVFFLWNSNENGKNIYFQKSHTRSKQKVALKDNFSISKILSQPFHIISRKWLQNHIWWCLLLISSKLNTEVIYEISEGSYLNYIWFVCRYHTCAYFYYL